MPDGLVWVFQKPLIYWDFHAQPSLGFTENGQKKRKYPVGIFTHINTYIGKTLPGLMSLDFFCDIQMVGSEFGVKNMDPFCLVSTVQAGGGGLMVWGIFSWHTLGPLVPIEHCLKCTAYLSIVADHVHPFMTTVYPSSDGYFQRDNAPCHKAQIISDWFLEHDNEFTLLKWPPVTKSQSNRAHLGCGGTRY